MKKVLFVCTGNVCRSFVAARLLAHLQGGKKSFEIDSCGVGAQPYYKTPGDMLELLSKEGLEAVEHRPKLVTERLIDEADLILVMEKMHAEVLADLFPQSRRKTQLLKVYVKNISPGFELKKGEEDFFDPTGRGRGEFEKTFSLLKDCMRRMLEYEEAVKQPGD